MSRDGKMLYISVSDDVASERPYYFTTGMVMNLETGKVDTLFQRQGFIGGAQFSPDGKKLLFTGTPEAFGGIGNVCPEGMIPNNYEHELFLMDLDTKDIEPLTKDLDPSVNNVHWSLADNHLYAVCENKDLVSVFRLDMTEKKGVRNGKWEMMQLNEPNLKGNISLAKEKPMMVYTGLSGETTDHSWVLDLKKNKHTSLTDLNPTRLNGIAVGKCLDWTYKTERGDSITGCYYLPPYFDETKQYPMLVYYYGGVSPVGRVLESPYNYQAWAAMGYVVYVLQPSGCTGFGQEFAARHSNAWGDYTADDIINGTKQFVKEHSFVNPKKIGCMGASYGGFMTQYLQTRTDIFAAAMSHAGISSIASYWGEGNWGYTYSAAASPNSYPWNNTKLYTEHAPLFNADKINTPILFMHGTVDDNVPMGESIQMFNALKILGKETAFIMVDGENHYIGDHNKRIRWHDSIMAWFQKWLQDDPTWWNDMYPEKNL
jgi:dipeptidyl aminopeptidase/acylaminoacyl peptidase